MAKGLRELHIPWTTQPDGEPDVDWNNPITKDLRGLVWTGPNQPRELVGGIQWPNASSVLKVSTPYGVSTENTSTNGGVYSVRQNQETSANNASNWRPTAPPATIAFFGSITNPGASRAFFGVVGSGGTEGLVMTSAYATATRFAHVGTGAGTRAAVDGSSSPTIPGDTVWYSGVGLKVVTVDSALIKIYDHGLLRATNAGSASNIFYDTTFGRAHALGSSDTTGLLGVMYWGGIWGRALDADEILSLQQNPWQLFKPKRILLPPYAPIGVPTLTDAQVTALAETTARPRVTLTF